MLLLALRVPRLAAPVSDAEETEAAIAGVAVDRFDEHRGYTTVESWQLRDVADGRVPPEVLVLFLAIQAHGRAAAVCWPGNARLAEMLRVTVRTVQRGLSTLTEAGWLTKGWRTWNGKPQRVMVCLKARAERPSPPDAGRHGGGDAGGHPPPDAGRHPNHLHLNQHQGNHHPPPPPQGGGVATPGTSAEKPKRKEPGMQPPQWALDAAQALLAVYPHGVTKGGAPRRPGRTHVARRLVIACRGVDGQDRVDLIGRMIAAATREAKRRPPGSEDRAFSKGLDVWLNQCGWEAVEETPDIDPTQATRTEQAARRVSEALAGGATREDAMRAGVNALALSATDRDRLTAKTKALRLAIAEREAEGAPPEELARLRNDLANCERRLGAGGAA